VAFRGQHEHSLDAKDRLTVPSGFRAELSGEVVLAKAPDTCLWLMPKDTFEDMVEKFVAPHSPFSANARRLRRVLNANAIEGELDAAGRIRVPRKLAEAAGLDGTCAINGAGEYIEIWNAAAWQEEGELLDFATIAEESARAGES